MTQDQIEQAAIMYAEECEEVGNIGEQIVAHLAFIAGAESRQAEIEEWKQKSIDATCRNDEARDIMIPELYDALSAIYYMVADGDNCEGAIYNAQKILKKHSK